jgi:hypothetical protein
MSRALTRVDRSISGLAEQGEARASAAVAELDRRARAAEQRLGAVIQLANMDPPRADMSAVAAAEADYVRSRERLVNGQQGLERMRRVRRRVSNATSTHVPAATASLQSMQDDVGRYRASGLRLAGTGGSPASDGGNRSFGRAGLEEVDISKTTTADNPILDAGKGGATAADYVWAVQAWDSVVRPSVAGGATREDFERRDSERDAPAFRRLADVYDLFLGESDRIVLSRGSDGILTVTNGRHRIEAARRVGVTSLPAKVLE